ncbi:MAG TPA: RDD family protein [Flavobacteriaceae bacterium]|nr:RDD family protein [Flavobacteriaceae bacterium]
MDNFQIESAQNVTLQQNVASIWDRILAFLIDGLVLVAFSILMSIAINGLGLDNMEQWVFMLVLGLPYFLYHLLFETFANGQSLGKAAMKIRVVKLDGSTPAFSNYVIRWLLRIVDISMTSGSVAVVTILLNGKGQRLGDIAASTTVISERERVSIGDTLLVEIPENYQPLYPQVRVFSDGEIQTIKKLFLEAKMRANHNIILSLSKKVATLMEVTPKEKPMHFLETVIADYNYYTQL